MLRRSYFFFWSLRARRVLNGVPSCFTALKVFMVILVISWSLVVPANYHGGNQIEGLDALSMSNVEQESTMLWVHVVASYLITFVTMYLMRSEFMTVGYSLARSLACLTLVGLANWRWLSIHTT